MTGNRYLRELFPEVMQSEDFIKNFENAIDGIAPGSITPETEFQQLAEWDSLAFLTLLAMIDEEYNVEIEGARIHACRTIQDLFEIIRDAK